MKIVNIHLPNSKNIGDEVCSPVHYFDIDATIIKLGDEIPSDQDVVIWGGGCIASQAPRDIMYGGKYKRVIWGAGVTQRGVLQFPKQPSYQGIDLAGIRDFPNPAGTCWVACPSTMSSLFDNPPEPTQDIVYYGHKALSPMESMNNDHMNFEEVVAHLQKGQKIVTSSYHGMVWGTILGREVEVIPFGAKFYGWPWMNKRAPTDILSICRETNLEFYEKFNNLLSSLH